MKTGGGGNMINAPQPWLGLHSCLRDTFHDPSLKTRNFSLSSPLLLFSFFLNMKIHLLRLEISGEQMREGGGGSGFMCVLTYTCARKHTREREGGNEREKGRGG